MISELHPTKRIVDAVHAMKDLVDEYPELILVVLGEGGERTTLDSLIGCARTPRPRILARLRRRRRKLRKRL